MAKNKNNNYKNSNSNSSKNNAGNSSSKNTAGGSVKDTHSQVPDKGSGSRSGPGGE